jgi:hypothetical protein
MNLKHRILRVINIDKLLMDTKAAIVMTAIGVVSPIILTALDGKATINAVFLIHCTFMAAARQLLNKLRGFRYFVFFVAIFQLVLHFERKSLDKGFGSFLSGLSS